jgi:hypothetical protein
MYTNHIDTNGRIGRYLAQQIWPLNVRTGSLATDAFGTRADQCPLLLQ